MTSPTLLLLSLLVGPTVLDSVSAKPMINHGDRLIDWLTKNDGYFHPNLELRRQVVDDNGISEEDTPFYGMFATKAIPKGEILLEVPQRLVLSPHEMGVEVGDRISVYFPQHKNWFNGEIVALGGRGSMDVQFDDGDFETVFADAKWEREEDFDCSTVRRLVEEAALGEDSLYAPYIQYLQSQPRGQLPALWSEPGKDLLREVLGRIPGSIREENFDNYEEHERKIFYLPPDLGARHSYAQDFHDRCSSRLGVALTDVEFDAHLNWYALLNQRGWDELMIPVFDMMSHGNGRLLNTDHNSVRDGESVQVYSSRDIAQGEEIYTTYNFCANCENRFFGYGTPELMRDYGFVEGFPQRWFFPEKHLAFELDASENALETSENYNKIQWLHKIPPKESFVFLREQLLRLFDLSKTLLADPDTLSHAYDTPIPQQEWDTIVKYQKALVIAISEALKSVGLDPLNLCDGSNSDDACHARLSYYDALEFVDPRDEEWIVERPTTCNEGPEGQWHPFHTNPSRGLQTIHSPYQDIEFYHNVLRNNDTCFQLDSVVQICTSYRPDYHEMVVHNTARYLEDDLERVVFVGGGDSMLLYDIIKYPTLKKVVGLEIDQHVTRASFEHFGTEPHWDNEKVEWWFGDASKSLLMLPVDYFGSFDMVLVDLSETAASLTVTEHLNVMEALSLLLKPNGILVKNEYNYFPEQKSVFRETLHIHYYEVPYVCSQSLILGSNGIDFMRGRYTVHDIEHIYPLLDDPSMQYAFVHDYEKNYTNPLRYCETKAEDQSEPPEQQGSPGVMMIIEAENTTMNLSSADMVQAIVERQLVDQGFRVQRSFVPTTSYHNVFVTVLQEGYVVARMWPEHEYIGFDFQLWSSFGKQEMAKRALIEGVGSEVSGQSSSSYRVVTGGMFGLDTWREDEKRRGPKLPSCDEIQEQETPKVYDGPLDMEGVLVALEECQRIVVDVNGYEMSHPGGHNVAVLCGGDEQPCKSVGVLEKQKQVANVIVLKSCAGIEDFEFTPDGLRRMADCEVSTWTTLKQKVARAGRIRFLIVDPTASHSMAQIVDKVSSSPVSQRIFFEENMTVVAPLLDLSEGWRRSFVDKFRTEIFPRDPTFRSDVFFNSSSTSFLLSVASNGDFHFAQRLVEFVDRTQKRTRLIGEIQNVRGSTYDGFIVQDPIITDNNFTDADFNPVSQLEHWNSQHPLGLQVIFQFEIKEKRANSMTAENARNLLERSLTSAIATNQEVQYETFSGMWDGTLITAFWSDGSAILLHDGRMHMDVNLFLYEEDFQKVLAFETAFTACTTFARCAPEITRTLRDTQPRGKGRVVSFMRDLRGLDDSGKPVKIPRWAASG